MFWLAIAIASVPHGIETLHVHIGVVTRHHVLAGTKINHHVRFVHNAQLDTRVADDLRFGRDRLLGTAVEQRLALEGDAPFRLIDVAQIEYPQVALYVPGIHPVSDRVIVGVDHVGR